MKKFFSVFACLVLVGAAEGGWWPFGSDDKPKEPRLSELMEKASELIDEANDLAAEGKTEEAGAKFREALAEIDRVEAANPERAATPEFASLRNKRAYVSASYDSLMLQDAKKNARAVAVSDSTELERKFAALRRARRSEVMQDEGGDSPRLADPEKAIPEVESQLDEFVQEERDRAKKTQEVANKARAKRLRFERLYREVEEDAGNRRARLALIGEYLVRGETEKAVAHINYLLEREASDTAALNLQAVCAIQGEDFESAERALLRAMEVSPGEFNAFYNMAHLKLQASDKTSARSYYEVGRQNGGPVDEALEAQLK